MSTTPRQPEPPDADDPTITAITPRATDPNQRRISVDGRAVMTLRATDVETLDVSVGDAWTAEIAAAAQRLLELASVRATALALLGRRDHAAAELLDKLMRKGHAESLARTIVAEMVADRWIDDEAFAHALAEELTRRAPAAPAMIAARLARRGIAADLADRVAAAVTEGEDAVQSAERLARASLRTITPSAAAVRRVAGLLGRRGFDEDTVATVIDRLGLMPVGPDEVEPADDAYDETHAHDTIENGWTA